MTNQRSVINILTNQRSEMINLTNQSSVLTQYLTNKNPVFINLHCAGGLSLTTFSYFSYGMNGYGSPNAKLTGRVLESAGEIVFLLLLLLLAKGYTVTRLVNRSR